MVRYGPTLGPLLVQVSLERPSPDLTFSNPEVEAGRKPLPDLAAALEWDFGEGSNVRAAGLARWLSYDAPGASDTALGWGVMLNTVLTWTRTGWRFPAQVHYGQGIGSYVSDMAGQGLDAVEAPSFIGRAGVRAPAGASRAWAHRENEWRQPRCSAGTMMLQLKRSLAASLLLLAAAGCSGNGGGEDPSSRAPGAVQSPASTPSQQPEPGRAPDTATPSLPSSGASAGATPLTSCALPAGLPSQQGDLRAWLGQASITASGSNGFREPQGTELTAFERAFRELLAGGSSPERVKDFADLGYSLSAYRDEATGNGWLVLADVTQGRGGGTFILNLNPARDLWLETPHADSDQGTLRQGAEQLVALGARALLITGANRCAVTTSSPCTGTTRMCGAPGLRASDSAHYANNFFTSAHRALRAVYPDGVAVSVHGMETSEDGPEAAVISDGTTKRREGSLATRLRDALNTHLPAGPRRAFSCNAPDDSGKHRMLCGTTNVQGRIDNGAGDGCYADAPSASDRFIHLEQTSPLRGTGPSSDAVIQALADTVPCSLPGNGLGCPAAATATACR